jgi:choline-glycine betaine transporter
LGWPLNSVAAPQFLCTLPLRQPLEVVSRLGAEAMSAMLIFLRFLAAVFLLIAVVTGVYDGTRSLSAHGPVMTSLLEHWSKLAPAMLSTARGAVRRSTHPLVWDLGIGKLLLLPAWSVFALLGMLAAYAGRRRRRTNIFAN